METLNEIANAEFGMDYHQLDANEQEWCRDEQQNQLDIFNLPDEPYLDK